MGIDDAAELQATLQALAVVGVPDAETTELFHALAGILQLGNVRFARAVSAGGESVASIGAGAAAELAGAAGLLGVAVPALQAALTTKKLQVAREWCGPRIQFGTPAAIGRVLQMFDRVCVLDHAGTMWS